MNVQASVGHKKQPGKRAMPYRYPSAYAMHNVPLPIRPPPSRASIHQKAFCKKLLLSTAAPRQDHLLLIHPGKTPGQTIRACA